MAKSISKMKKMKKKKKKREKEKEVLKQLTAFKRIRSYFGEHYKENKNETLLAFDIR